MSDTEWIKLDLTVDDLLKQYPQVRKCPDDPRPRITSSFWITGDPLDFAACTEAVGVEPTTVRETRVSGRWMPSGRPRTVPASWTLKVVHEPCDDVDYCVADLLSRIWPRVEQIKEFLARNLYDAGFYTGVTIFEDRPIYSLSATSLKRLADFGVEWSLDIFGM